MFIYEELKHILILQLPRCSETVCVLFIIFTAKFCYKVAHKKKKIPFVRFKTQSIPS